MIDRSDPPPPGRPPDPTRALRDAFLREIGMRGAPEGARIVGRYLLLEPIGQGASGTVWRALHRELLQEVAVKIVELQNGAAPDRIERFRREATTAARLHHPGIVAVHDFGSDEGAHYLAMELVEGRPLDRWLAEEKPDLDRRLALLEQVARAAQHAHEQGVVHRDLKPANIVVRALDVPVIVDFGVARARDDDHLTRDGGVIGTIAFMAPEQLRGEREVDARADVWALGMLLHYVATGALPFPVDESPAEALRARLAPGPRPSRVDPTLPRALDVLVQRCLEPDAALRLASAGALADDLARLRRGEPIVAGATTLVQRLWRHVRQRPLKFAFALGAVLVLALGAWLLPRTLRQGRELSDARGSLDQKSRVLQIQAALLDLSPRLKPLFVRAERARYKPLPDDETAALLGQIDQVLASSGDETGVRDAYRAYSIFLLKQSLADAAFESAKRSHPDNPIVWLLSGRAALRRCAETAGWSSTQPVTYELLVEPLATPSRFHSHPAVKAVVASARDDLERARAILSEGGVPGLDWALRLCQGFERFAAGDAKAVIERLEPLVRNDEIDLEATMLLCFALVQDLRVPDAVEQSRRLHDSHPGVAPASRLLALCMQVAARDRLERSESPIAALEEARALFAEEKGASLIDDIVAAQVEFDLEVARYNGGGSSAAAWAPIVARWIGLRDRTLATNADARARGAAHARVGWARINAALFLIPRAAALPTLRAAAEDYRLAAEFASDSIWVGAQRAQSRARAQEVLARVGLPIERAEVDGGLQDVSRLRELSNGPVRRNDWGLAMADVSEAQLRFFATLAGDRADPTRADAFDRAAQLAHAADARCPQVGFALPVELECRLHELLARRAPVERLREWAAELVDPLLTDGGVFNTRWVRPLLEAAFEKERRDRIETATLAADVARRAAGVLPDEAVCHALVVESELALRLVDAGNAAAHVDAALACADAFLARHAKNAEAELARALALSALADLGGRDGLGSTECLAAMRETVAAPIIDDDERALLLAVWLSRRSGDEVRMKKIAGRVRTRIEADPDARLAVRTQLRLACAALDLPDAPQDAVASARAWDEIGQMIGECR